MIASVDVSQEPVTKVAATMLVTNIAAVGGYTS